VFPQNRILNQYCMSLPIDRFTKIRETYRRIDLDNGLIQVAITLPNCSMIHSEIFGECKEDVRLAKQHAAFEVCKTLIKNGSLTENLVPISAEQKIEVFTSSYFSHWENYKNDQKGKAGTKNNRRVHKMKIPDVLKESGPSSDKINYIYCIDIKPEFDASDDLGLKVFHELIGSKNTFGILTAKRIPRLCKIPLFQSFGKIMCEINPLPTAVSIADNSKLQLLRRFHVNIFRDILKVFKKFCVIDKSSYLVVPLDEYQEINWTLVEQFKDMPPPQNLSNEQIKSMVFEPEDYLYKVINPVYRCSDQNYVVVDVLTHKTPQSPFPDQTRADTYATYYKLRDHEIKRNDQFLVEVKGIANNYNLFFPGTGSSGENKKSQKKLREEYVPELCHNYTFPGDYWLKATLLPAICHRMHYLLIAEELRMWLIKEQIDLGRKKQTYELDVDYGNYDERSSEAMEYYAEDLDELENFDKFFHDQSNAEKQAKKSQKQTLSVWNNNKMMPVDLDRNLMNITEADIDYYVYFTGKHSSTHSNLRDNKIYAKRHGTSAKALKDSASRADIGLIHLTSENNSIQQKDLIKVLTTANSGDVFDMERFETLGDAYLKFIASLFLFKNHDNLHEGHLTALKGRLVSNRNLFYIGNDFGLSNMLKSSQFCVGETLQNAPPSSTIPGKVLDRLQDDKTLLNRLFDLSLSNNEMETGDVSSSSLNEYFTREPCSWSNSDTETVDKGMLAYANENYIGDKVIADAVEAFIGCVVSSTGPLSALKLCQKLKIISDTDEELLTEKIPPRVSCVTAGSNYIANCALLEETIQYEFKNKLYLRQALTHTSYPISDCGTYESLEFLGDAVLDFLVS
jgi:endoribonuclease Dicer